MKIKIALVLIVFFIMVGCSSEQDIKNIKISNAKISIDAVKDTTNAETQKFTYDITIQNPADLHVVNDYDLIPAKIIKDQMVDWHRKGIEYNDKTIELTGTGTFSTKGLPKSEMTHFAPLIKGVQFVADDHKEYLLLVNKPTKQ
ncbi:MAG TPA: hypothetical protein VFK33_02490 [Bacillales bacterium]|nr:hypothetical protein [Bacillales bacterium]